MLRKIYFLVVLLITTSITTKLLAQTTGPDGVIFQAVATDPQGNPAANRTIYIKDAILQTTATGTVVYSETFQVTASSTGVFTIVIGKGQRLSGPTSIASLDWSAGPYFLNLKAAVAPSVPLTNWIVDQQYVDMGTSQFWTVPFAMYASKVAGFDLKLNIADTANMLKPYMKRSDTTTLSARIDANKTAIAQETTRATAAEALKANIADVTTSLALKANINNPTFTGTVGGIDKTMVGLNNVDNTSDVNKPISTATQTALNLKANTTDVTTSLALKANIASPTFTGTVGGITKSMVGLNNVDNTSDINKPVSTATQTILNNKANSSDVTIGLALKAPIESPTFTGTVSGVTKSMVGLGNVDNTSDAAKPISTATQTALNLKANTTDVTTSLALKANINNPTFTGLVIGIDKTMVGLGNTDNTSDIAKPISSATQTVLNLKENEANKSTITTLGTSDVLFPTQNAVKTYVDVAISSATPEANATTKGKIQLAGDLGGTAAAPTVPGLALKADVYNPTFTGTVEGITKSMVGLGNADNTSDVNKPISIATQIALDLKENTANKSTTTTLGTSDVFYPTQNAVKTYVDATVSGATLDASASTKGKIQLTGDLGGTAALPTVPALATKANTSDVTTSLVLKANLASPIFSGTPSLPTGTIGVTQTAGDNTTALATTAFVMAANSTNANLTGVVTSVGNATSIASGAITNAMLANSAVGNLSGINTGDNAP
ncbi:MAG: hypothetical protein NTY72_15265, partial [Bacteroidetes bacterium]|nr:hypothetical protein [Bacteroidota bacterium]